MTINTKWFYIFIFFVQPCYAIENLSMLYDTAELEYWKTRYLPNMTGVWSEDLYRYLTDEEKSIHDEIGFHFALPQDQDKHGDQFSVAYSCDPGSITYPPLNVKLIDDLSIATAFLQKSGDFEQLNEYIRKIKSLKTTSNSEKLNLSPLPAMGIPEDIYEQDEYVDDVSQKLLKTAVVWLMAHNLGHIYLGHCDNSGAEYANKQYVEIAADRFATEIMRRMGVPPIGLSVYFNFVAQYRENPHSGPHPISSLRLRFLAEHILDNKSRFLVIDTDELDLEVMLNGLADALVNVADSLEHMEDKRK